MKNIRSYLYLVYFIGAAAVLIGFDSFDNGTIEWVDNLLQAAFITLFLFLFTKGSSKKEPEEK